MYGWVHGVIVSGNANRDSDTRIVDPDADRDRGILTPHDRSFLLAAEGEGEGVRDEMSDSAVRQKRHKIRNRFRNALIDIQYLLLLEDGDLSRLFPADEWDDYELGIVHGAVLAAVYHMIRAEADREEIFNTLEAVVANDVIREYAEKHGVYAPEGEVGVEIGIPPVEECPTLEEVREVLEAGEEIPESAHMALDYGGIHPNPEEHL
ncbi:hypothetical protein SAMN05216564_1246 [Halopenitus persicus]|uniref:Domain of unknown function domain-containing protein n=2 Tax=Halopenitus persicus TaxID=1048396 RepID=A0A1H3PBB3_9EURY|nr:hypothetical protein SAMN05216564_1246 [Halopenitus persicus]